jgi:transketolase
MPKLRVFRPADAIETAECWQMALERTDGPTMLALTRQNLPQVRRDGGAENRSAAGAYELSPASAKARATLFASGSEVEIALAAQKLLDEQSFAVRVVSVPEKVRARIIGDAPIKVAIEAAVRFGWDSVIGPDGIFVGMHGFGASAPYKDLYKHFGITAEAVAEKVLRTHNL